MTLSDRLRALGPYAAPESLSHTGSIAGVGAPPWVDIAEIIASPTWLPELYLATRAALAANAGIDAEQVEPRIPESTAHLAVLARVVSPAVSLAALTDRWVDTAAHLRLRRVGHTVETAWDFDAATAQLQPDAHALVSEVVLPLGARVVRDGLPKTIAQGNSASAIRGAANALSYVDRSVAQRAHALITPLLDDPQLKVGWNVLDGQWRRRSCCLYYRMPGGGLCGDCVLTKVPVRP